MNYDIIGDIHGHADRLTELFTRIGYHERSGVWTPPAGTETIFLGDFIDRGEQNRQVLRIVRGMLDAGHARSVMGNHELNAITYFTPVPGQTDAYLRPRNEEKTRQHAAFLKEYAHDPAAWQDAIDFFYTLPLVLELPDAGLRVVHACWSPPHVAALRAHPLVHDDRVAEDFLVAAHRKPSPEHAIIETLLKGPEVALPAGVTIPDKEGTPRDQARYRWWSGGEVDSPDRLVLPAGVPRPDVRLTGVEALGELEPDGVPVFFGHYWWEEEHAGPPVGPSWACLDLSVARNGKLGCYRWREEDRGAPLSAARLVRV